MADGGIVLVRVGNNRRIGQVVLPSGFVPPHRLALGESGPFCYANDHLLFVKGHDHIWLAINKKATGKTPAISRPGGHPGLGPDSDVPPTWMTAAPLRMARRFLSVGGKHFFFTYL